MKSILVATLLALALLPSRARAQNFEFPARLNGTRIQIAGTSQTVRAQLNFAAGCTNSDDAANNRSSITCAGTGAPIAAPQFTVNGTTARITDSNGAPAAGICEFEIDTAYPNGGVGLGCSFGVVGRNCAVAQWMPISSNVAQGQLVCATGGLGVAKCAATVNLTTVIGVAIGAGSSGGVVPICIGGHAGVLTSDANCAFGAMASTDGTTAGNIQCTTAPVIGSLVGKVVVTQSGGVAQVRLGF